MIPFNEASQKLNTLCTRSRWVTCREGPRSEHLETQWSTTPSGINVIIDCSVVRARLAARTIARSRVAKRGTRQACERSCMPSK
jgi:hypothetical protein